MAARIADRVKYRQRITTIIENPPSSTSGFTSEIEVQAHWAKYSCVLISGYIEQALREILVEHTAATAAPRVAKYVEGTWPTSKNMKCDAIREILEHFDPNWSTKFDVWLDADERKKEINEIIKWRNDIAHGKESNTTNVTLSSVKRKLSVACALVDFVESLPVVVVA
jgi:hypothetical protein